MYSINLLKNFEKFTRKQLLYSTPLSNISDIFTSQVFFKHFSKSYNTKKCYQPFYTFQE